MVFLGRIDEPRKGLDVLLAAMPALLASVADVRLLVAGPGDAAGPRARLDPRLRDRVDLIGLVSDADKPRVFASGQVYCAPNTGQESFGIVLLEAMAAGTPVVASDLDAFRRVLDDGRAGRLFEVGDPARLAEVLAEVLTDPGGVTDLVRHAHTVAQAYDWRTIAERIVGVYRMVSGDGRVSVASS